MGNQVWAAVGSSRPWLSIAVGVVAVASLAGCADGHPIANGGQPTASSNQSTAAITASPGVTASRPAATASVPSSATPTAAKSAKATHSPSGRSSAGGSSAPGSSSSTGSGSGSGSGSASCVTSSLQNSCGPYHYPQIQGAAAWPGVTNDVWNRIDGWQQTLYANSPGNWHVVATGPAGNTAVVSYPDTQTLYGDRPVSSFSNLYSSFSENMHAQGGTSGEAAYDIFLNDWSKEVMIMHDMHNIGTDPQLATVRFGGSHGVPLQTWNLVHNGSSELIWMLTGPAEQSGRVDILAMVNWLASHGYVPAKSKLTDIDYGFEICSTGGVPETFTVNSYSVTAS